MRFLRCRRPLNSWGLGFFALAICLTTWGPAQENNVQMAFRAKEKSKLREGARLVDKIGRISERGGRHFFSPEGDTEQFTLLENQTLERVTSASSNQDDGQIWTITAVVTEFHGARFLLLERAVLRPNKGPRAKTE
jgi:hypothetical protein